MAKKRSNNKLELAYSSDFDQSQPFTGKSYSPQSLRHVKAETEPQAEFFDAFYRQTPLIFQMGSPGTGKSFTAIYGALSEIYDKDTPYEKLIIVRSAVQSRDIGFLKGTEEEKNASYEAIYEAMFDDLHVYKTKNYQNLKDAGKVQFMNTSFLRGRTFDRSILVIDEAQNLSYSELYTVVTRLGMYSKVVFCGDYKQSDLRGNEKNGFHRFLKVIQAMPEEMTHIVEYKPEHIIRSPLVKAFIMADEQVSDEIDGGKKK